MPNTKQSRNSVTGRFTSTHTSPSVRPIDKLNSIIADLRLSNNKLKQEKLILQKSKAAYIKQNNSFKIHEKTLNDTIQNLYNQLDVCDKETNQIKTQLVSYLIPFNLVNETVACLTKEHKRIFRSLKFG